MSQTEESAMFVPEEDTIMRASIGLLSLEIERAKKNLDLSDETKRFLAFKG